MTDHLVFCRLQLDYEVSWLTKCPPSKPGQVRLHWYRLLVPLQTVLHKTATGLLDFKLVEQWMYQCLHTHEVLYFVLVPFRLFIPQSHTHPLSKIGSASTNATENDDFALFEVLSDEPGTRLVGHESTLLPLQSANAISTPTTRKQFRIGQSKSPQTTR